MLGKQQLMAFVPTTDAGKARPFYERILGLAVQREDAYGITFDAHGVELRMSIVPELKPLPFTILGWVVEDIESMMGVLGQKGVIFERYSFLEQDAAGIWSAPDGTKVAWFKDPDGNTLSLAQY
jgi:predicted enzyme related to lactoylglutathione lyase